MRESRGHHDDGVSVHRAFIAGVHARRCVRRPAVTEVTAVLVRTSMPARITPFADARHLEGVGGPL